MSQGHSLDRNEPGSVFKDETASWFETIVKYSLIFIAVVIFFWAIYYAKAFLIPLTFAAILAMMLVPITRRLESWGWNRLWSSFTSVLILIIVVSGLVFLLSARASDFASHFLTIRQQATEKYQAVRQTVQEQWRISLPSLGEFLSDKPQFTQPSQDASAANQARPPNTEAPAPGTGASNWSTGASDTPSTNKYPFSASNRGESNISASWLSSIARPIAQWLSSLMSTFGDMLLALVYIFTLLYYRDKFVEFLLRATPDESHIAVNRIIKGTSGVARKYLWGRFILIFILAILYGIGFMVIGLKHALFLALTAAIFTFLPYIGPFIGIAFPVLVALASEHAVTPLLGVAAVYLVTQFVESYILEPIIVGAEVDINPFFTILAVVAGGLLWGVSGMILGIPILGIIRIILDNIEPLRPYAFLLGEEQKDSTSSKLAKKIKSLLQAS